MVSNGMNAVETTERVAAKVAVAQYAVLEANAKVNGRGPFSHLYPSETPQPISMSRQIYYYFPQRVDLQNLVGIDSVVTDLRMREKTRFCVNFFIINVKLNSLNMVLEDKSHV